MVRCKTILLSFLLVIILIPMANATPLYVTVEGVQSTWLTDFGYINTVSMVIMVDSDRQGTYNGNEYDDVVVQGEAGPEVQDYLYADLVSYTSTYEVELWEAYTSSSPSPVDQNYALVNAHGDLGHESRLNISSSVFYSVTMTNDCFGNLWTDGLSVGNWTGYTSFSVGSRRININNMYITSITDENGKPYPYIPTPEPATFFLLFSGMFSLFGFKRKQRK